MKPRPRRVDDITKSVELDDSVPAKGNDGTTAIRDNRRRSGNRYPHHALHDVGPWSPKSRASSPATSIVQRYVQRKSSREETILETYFGHISPSHAREIVGVLWGMDANLLTLVGLFEETSDRIQRWLRRPLPEEQPYVFLHSLVIRQRLPQGMKQSTLAVATGINDQGISEVLGIGDVSGNDDLGWSHFAETLRSRGMKSVRLFIGGNAAMIPSGIGVAFPKSRYQIGWRLWERETLASAPLHCWQHLRENLESMRLATSKSKAISQFESLAEGLLANCVPEIASGFETNRRFLLSYFDFPPSDWERLRDGYLLAPRVTGFHERIRIIGPIEAEDVLILLLAARLRRTIGSSG